MKTPFFSIIIPTFNREKEISRAIESVLNQTFKDFEILVIDNASSDNTVNEIKEFNDSRIKLFCNSSNLERCASRNIGINNSKGNYICFLDSDDYYLENHLKEFKENIDKSGNETDMFISNCRIYYENLSKFEYLKYSEFNNISYFLINAVIPSRVCISSSVLKKFKFENKYLIVEDTVLWMQISNKFKTKTFREPTVVYTIHDNNSVNLKFNTYSIRLKGLKKFFAEHNEIRKKINKRLINETYNRCYLGIHDHYKLKKKKKLQLRILVKSILIYPNIEIKHKIKLFLEIFKNSRYYKA